MSTEESKLTYAEPVAPADPAAPGAPGARDVIAQLRPLAQVLLTLVRREFWEHRVLWIAPLAVAVLLVASAFLTSPGAMQLDFSSGGSGPSLGAMLDNHRVQLALFGLEHWAMSLPQYLVLSLVLTFYLCDCLYAERRDRSILFWKSLPVSDFTTVASKALVGLVLVPCGVYLLAVATDALMSLIGYVRAQFGAHNALLTHWDTVAWLKMQALMGLGMLLSILWLSPLGAYLLLVSAWARRNVMLWASVPPLVGPLVERLTFGTWHLLDLLSYRSVGMFFLPELAQAKESASFEVGSGSNHLTVLSPVELFDHLPVLRVFTNIQLWLGVVAALAMLFLAARIRRYRDES